MSHVLQRGVTGEHHRASAVVGGGRQHGALQHRDRTTILPHPVEHAEKCSDQDQPRWASAGHDTTTSSREYAEHGDGRSSSPAIGAQADEQRCQGCSCQASAHDHAEEGGIMIDRGQMQTQEWPRHPRSDGSDGGGDIQAAAIRHQRRRHGKD
jgi:hypothetical protein